VMRHPCNGRLREAVYHWARISVQHDERSALAYAASRGRGHTHGRALRNVADRLLRILIAMLKTRTLYVPGALHSARRTSMLRARQRFTHESPSKKDLDNWWGVPLSVAETRRQRSRIGELPEVNPEGFGLRVAFSISSPRNQQNGEGLADAAAAS